MATVTSNVHLSDRDEPALRLFETYPGHFGISLDIKPTPVAALTLFGTLDQLEDVARQIERLVILAREDQREDLVRLTPAGETALDRLEPLRPLLSVEGETAEGVPF